MPGAHGSQPLGNDVPSPAGQTTHAPAASSQALEPSQVQSAALSLASRAVVVPSGQAAQTASEPPTE